MTIARWSFLAALLLAPSTADAFCGFYVSGADSGMFNNATQVVLMREGTRGGRPVRYRRARADAPATQDRVPPARSRCRRSLDF